jgi:hypothetical protein
MAKCKLGKIILTIGYQDFLVIRFQQFRKLIFN